MRFTYEAARRDGRVLKGELEAASERDARKILEAQDLALIHLALAAEKPRLGNIVIFQSAISDKEIALVIRELATLLAAGVPLAEAVESIASARSEDRLGTLFGKVHAGLRSGEPLSQAMERAGLVLPPYVMQLLKAGEMTGKLAPALKAGAQQMEHEEQTRQEIRNSLVYPIILVLAGIAATLLVFVLVVPKFAKLLRNGKANLPDISVWVLQSGVYVKDHLQMIALIALVVLVFLAMLLRRPAVQRAIYAAASRMPLIGPWLVETESGRWASMLATLLENRVPVMSAMALAAEGLPDGRMRQSLALAERDVRAGKPLADALKAHQVIGPMALNLVRVGERSGELPAMLGVLAGMCESASKTRLKRLVILIEPLTIMLVGGAIGFIMIAVMMAVTSLSDAAL